MNDSCFAGIAPKWDVIDADGVRLNYATWGDRGQDVVMLHGITSSAMTWWRVAPELVRLGCRVIAPDMPGHGDSGSPALGYRLSETAGIIDAFMSALSVRSPIVMGHSWGGGVALVLATASATKTAPSGLILIDPLVRMPTEFLEEYRQMLIEPLGKPRQGAVSWLREANPRWHKCDVHWKAEALEKGSREAVLGVFEECAGLDLLPELRSLQIPWALVVADAELGGIFPAAMWPELQATAGNHGRLFKMPGVGHDVQREDFAGLMANLEQFLENCGCRPFGTA